MCHNVKSVGKASFYVDFYPEEGSWHIPTPLCIQTGRGLLFSLVIILNLWKNMSYIA